MVPAITATSAIEQLQTQSLQLKSWFEHQPDTIHGLCVRKYPAWLEPQCFFKANDHIPFDTARFNLMMNNNQHLWQVTLDMVFYLKRRVTDEGRVADASILFTVLDDKDQPRVVDYLPVWEGSVADNISPEQWVNLWFKRLTKRPRLRRIFAYHHYLQELES